MNLTSSTMQRVAAMVALVLMVCAPARGQDPISITQATWGFDGTVVPQAFNLLTLEVRNLGREPFDGAVQLERSNGVQPVDAPVMEEVYLAAGASRQVQFFPYIIHGLRGASEWSVSWGVLDRRGRVSRFVGIGRMELNEPKLGEPATVIVHDPFAVARQRGGGGLPRFDEALFPSTVNGTRGLGAVVLDHIPPRWGPLQQQAFVDWIHAGGDVHVMQNEDGEFPPFDGTLQALNSPLDELRIGPGRVVKHRTDIAQMDAQFVKTSVLPPESDATREGENTKGQDFAYANYVVMDVNENLFMRMKQITRPDHNWALIYFMSLVYLLIVFPGCWLIGRRRADYRVTYGALLGAVALFSLGFKTVGQRGYGETTAAHAVALARPVAGGRMAVQQWTNLFVTNGGFYRAQHQADGRVYSTGQINEAVRGWVDNFPGGALDVDIPPFSSRTVVSATTEAPMPFGIAVETFTADERLQELKLRVQGTFPEEPTEVHAAYGDSVYTLVHRDGVLTASSTAQPLTQFLGGSTWQDDVYAYGPFGWGAETDRKQLFDGAVRPLMAASLGLYNDETLKKFRLPNDRVRLFVYAQMPAAMFLHVSSVAAPNQPMAMHTEGRVMYVLDVIRPE